MAAPKRYHTTSEGALFDDKKGVGILVKDLRIVNMGGREIVIVNANSPGLKTQQIDRKKIDETTRSLGPPVVAAARKAPGPRKHRRYKKHPWGGNRRARAGSKPKAPKAGRCRVCGCTEDNCEQCVKKTGKPCSWVDATKTLCSACVDGALKISPVPLDVTIEALRSIEEYFRTGADSVHKTIELLTLNAHG